ncbi:MAG: glycosyltransferase family 39 protein [Flavobacteriales bacterium]|nr:glycosyltransferase family 39 protein [Flavobacteriales bacterium]MBP9080664.1 glycosyltransferase family 39 protein [Flavobacteriales bacterium]
MNQGTRNSTGWLVAALVLVNLALKLAWTGVNELAGDEPFTVYWSLRPWSGLFGMLRTENNPPLYFLLMHGWMKLVPLEPAWLRVPSAVFSAFTVWPLFRLGWRLGGRTTGLTAALLFTFSQHGYAFAHEVRAYSLLVLACTWAVWQLVRLADDQHRHPAQRPASLVWLVAANVLATWAHYFGWLMVGLEVVLVFTVPLLRTVRIKLLAAVVLTLLCSLPLLGILYARAGASLGQGTWLDAPGWEEPYNMLMRWSNAPVVAVLFIALITAVLVFRRRRIRSSAMAMPLQWTLLPLVGMFLVSFLFPIYLDRYLLFAAPGFHLLVAVAVQAVPGSRHLRTALSAACVAAMALTFTPWKASGLHPSRVVAQAHAWREGATLIIIQPPWYNLTFAWGKDPYLFRSAAPLEMTMREQGILPVQSELAIPLDSSVQTVVHIDAWAALTDPQGQVLNTLRAQYQQVDSVEADKKVYLRRFTRR